VPEAIAATFFDLVFDRKVSRDWVTEWSNVIDAAYGEPMLEAARAPFLHAPSPSSPALPLSSYVGIYGNEYVGDGVVEQKEGSLVLRLGPDGKFAFPLKHFDRDLFLMYPLEEMPSLPYPVRFAIGADGKASQVTVDAFNDDAQGVLSRRGR
jgi:hypothetical protein